MASYTMHFAISKMYLENHPNERQKSNFNEMDFYEGTIDPDLTTDKGTSHYGTHAAWANAREYLKANENNIETSYKRGYFLHLLTDYLFYHKLIDVDKIIVECGYEKLGIKPSKEELEAKSKTTEQELIRWDGGKNPNFDEVVISGLPIWQQRQRHDFGVLNNDLIEKYDIQDIYRYIPTKIYDEIKDFIILKEPLKDDLVVFKKDDTFKFLEDMARIDLDKFIEEILSNEQIGIIELFERHISSLSIEER